MFNREVNERLGMEKALEVIVALALHHDEFYEGTRAGLLVAAYEFGRVLLERHYLIHVAVDEGGRHARPGQHCHPRDWVQFVIARFEFGRSEAVSGRGVCEAGVGAEVEHWVNADNS